MIEDDQKLSLELNRKGGRKAYKNDKLLTRQIDLIGPMRSVGFSALDLELIRGEPSLRRHWLDRIVQQLEPIYSDLIGRFSRLLRQRSQLWRNLSLESSKDQNILLVRGKGGKERLVPLTISAIDSINAYREVRHVFLKSNRESKFLFPVVLTAISETTRSIFFGK